MSRTVQRARLDSEMFCRKVSTIFRVLYYCRFRFIRGANLHRTLVYAGVLGRGGVLSASATLAPGYRYHTSGELVSGGRSGYSWSSSASGSNGMDLDFGAAWLNPHGAPYRTYGFQLRCLSE